MTKYPCTCVVNRWLARHAPITWLLATKIHAVILAMLGALALLWYLMGTGSVQVWIPSMLISLGPFVFLALIACRLICIFRPADDGLVGVFADAPEIPAHTKHQAAMTLQQRRTLSLGALLRICKDADRNPNDSSQADLNLNKAESDTEWSHNLDGQEGVRKLMAYKF